MTEESKSPDRVTVTTAERGTVTFAAPWFATGPDGFLALEDGTKRPVAVFAPGSWLSVEAGGHRAESGADRMTRAYRALDRAAGDAMAGLRAAGDHAAVPRAEVDAVIDALIDGRHEAETIAEGEV